MIREKVRAWLMKGASPVSPSNPHFQRIFGWDSEEQPLSEPYKQLPAVYACNRVLARNTAQVPWQLFQGDAEIPMARGPMVTLFETINPAMSKYQLWEAIVTQLGLYGESFLFLDKERVNGIPVALWPHNPKTVEPAIRNGTWVGWWEKTGGTRIFWDKTEVIQFKYWNPFDPLRGLSPLKALDMGLKSDWNAIRYNARFFSQGGHAGEIFSTDTHLDDHQYQRIKQELVDRREGMESAHKGLVLDGGLKVQDLRKTNKDMQFMELRKFTREEIAMVYGVPETELSLYKDIPYSNAVSADLGFWKKTLIPMMRLITDQINTSFLERYGIRGEFDIASIDVLNAEVLQKADAAKVYYEMGIPINQINERLGLGFEDIPGGEEPWGGRQAPVARDVTPAKQMIPEVTGSIEMETVPNELAFRELRKKKWTQLDGLVARQVTGAAKAVKRVFFEMQQALTRKVVKSVSGEEMAALALAVEETIDDNKVLAALAEFVGQAIKDGYVTITAKAPLTDEMVNNLILQRTQTIKGVSETLRQTLLLKLRDAMAEGATERERTQLVMDAIGDSFQIAKNRAQTIARTEVHSAFNRGRFESAKTTHPKSKMWVSAHDRNVRRSHIDVDGETVPWDGVFSNGLDHPNDWGGDPAEVINCRCTFVPIYDNEDEAAMASDWMANAPKEGE